MSALVRGKLERGLIALGMLAAFAAPGLSGCGPEGVGTMKPETGVRPPDNALGRPFGNAADVKVKPSSKKKANISEEDANKKVLNPRL